MPDLFWRTRLRREARKIAESLPNLPEELDDNVFIALATQAAQADKASGAYDEFMFSEDGYEKMPYEDSVDEIIALQIARNPERAGRKELPHLLRLEFFKNLVEDRQRSADDTQQEIDAVAALIGEEEGVLRGDRDGEAGGRWKGVAPDTLTKSKHVSRRAIGWLIFLIVAAVDTLVVFYSLRQLTPTQDEARFFTLPAVLVQILFPHLVGKAVASMRSKEKGDRLREIVIAWGVGVAWLAYVGGMTYLRFYLLQDLYKLKVHKPLPAPLAISIFIISLFILIGLGLWIMVRAMSENPHEGKYSRLRFSFLAKQRKLRRKLRQVNDAKALVKNEENAIEKIREKWQKRTEEYEQLGAAAKSAYRRALVNQFGTPDFTTAYLPKDNSRLNNSRRKERNDFSS